jgi:deoxyribodipyrimidine photo-lyase
MKTGIVWFKTDLRLNDNETLVRAIEQCERIIPVYVIDDSHFGKTHFGTLKTGAFRTQFLFESLENLDQQLRKKGSGLLVIKGRPEDEIPKLAAHYQAQKVFVKKEVAPEELNTHALVEAALWKLQIPIETYSTSTLYHAKDLPFSLKDIPEVFTIFRKKVEKDAQISMPFPEPEKVSSPDIAPLQLPALTSLGIHKLAIDKRACLQFNGGEESALKRLQHYFFDSKCLSEYKETRNQLIGADYSSKFSAWLAMGCISARYIYQKVKTYESCFGANKSTYWLIFELLWRDYFRFMMKKHKHHFFLQAGIKHGKEKLQKHQSALFEKWKNGHTGNDFVDANMLELKLTGFMSNRGRQNVASYLCHNLKLDWRFGAAYFEEQLIDYDVSSNWGNWMYIAGVGNDPRENRVFNMDRQAEMYDHDQSYRELWLQKEII